MDGSYFGRNGLALSIVEHSSSSTDSSARRVQDHLEALGHGVVQLFAASGGGFIVPPGSWLPMFLSAVWGSESIEVLNHASMVRISA